MSGNVNTIFDRHIFTYNANGDLTILNKKKYNKLTTHDVEEIEKYSKIKKGF
ncbi:hypothetical protein [Mycoplasmopsis alligatoris]|uniref:Conserved domain protein n=1 Tax=Mycoplasmopsis alligatoris A21JP2 TaxID=747682 RepID=D4XWD4_9BACT|nr:hypothetical protein [Mycoplasmopsis alligatoris]EFF41280.1 conserved domain protein [Mycoplasmopsis alligatoris A21JP2]